MIVVDALVLVNVPVEALQCMLVTADHRLSRAPGPLCQVEQIGTG
jgi:hypothetical protein